MKPFRTLLEILLGCNVCRDPNICSECGNLTCSRNHQGGDNCIDENAKTHYFYLAFENSICPDYISEKFWRNFNQPVIPVVLGGGNYSRDAPPHSYIDVNDFNSVKNLADYLKYLSENPKEYLAYFTWKYDYVMYQKNEWCRLCEKLHDSSEPVHWYSNMTHWFYQHENGKCTHGTERHYYQSMFF